VNKIFVVAFVLAALLVASVPAFAAAETMTIHMHGFSAPPEATIEPCSGRLGLLAITEGNGVFHVTVAANGSEHLTGTFEAKFTFVTGAVTYVGHFANWFGSNDNSSSEADTATLNIHATGSDGSTVNTHLLMHVNVNSSGQINMFFQLSCPPGQPMRI